MDEFEYRCESQYIGRDDWFDTDGAGWTSEAIALKHFQNSVRLEEMIVGEGGQKRYRYRIVRRPVGSVVVYLEEGDVV